MKQFKLKSAPVAAKLSLIFVLAAIPYLIFARQSDGKPSSMDAATARKEIAEAYEVWSKAREDVNVDVYEEMLTEDFYALIGGQKASRKDFIGMISKKQEGAKLVKFRTQILTVNPQGNDWSAVITEKLEIEIKGPDGKPQRVYALWVTRDGWRKTNGKWQACFTEAIGNEAWRRAKPPASVWG